LSIQILLTLLVLALVGVGDSFRPWFKLCEKMCFFEVIRELRDPCWALFTTVFPAPSRRTTPFNTITQQKGIKSVPKTVFFLFPDGDHLIMMAIAEL